MTDGPWRRRALWIAIALTVPAFALPVLQSSRAPAATGIRARTVLGGLNAPTAFTFGPGGTIWYVEKATGRIRVADPAGGTDRVFADVPGVNAEGERGMLGIALHPRFPDRPFVYVYATRSVRGHLRNQIVRLTDREGSGANLRVIFSAPASPSPYHNGGRILFGPDGMLYAIVGDGHDAANAQDRTANDRGKLLRMTAGGRAPASNPFPRSRIWAYGIRNSFGFAFDPRSGRLWETENGPSCNDELNRIARGRNFGWGPSETCAGQAPRNTNRDGPRPVLPERWYTPTIAPTGIAFCERCGLGAASDGTLFFGAYNTGAIRRVRLSRDRLGVVRQTVVYTHPRGIFSMEVGPDRGVYFSDAQGIYELVR
ncbi:MAG: sorbosone dehydrogenase family protein [Candidatus Velamenicoccus archaeovorus]